MSTKEFKVGDVVRLVNANDSKQQKRNLGHNGIITNVSASGIGYHVKFLLENTSIPVCTECLELVASKPQKPVLTRDEALKMAIDGARVRPVSNVWKYMWVEYDNGRFILADDDGCHDQADGVLLEDEWQIYSPLRKPQEPKFTVDSFVMNHANDIGKIKEVVTDKSDGILYRVSFNGLTTKVLTEDELKEAI